MMAIHGTPDFLVMRVQDVIRIVYDGLERVPGSALHLAIAIQSVSTPVRPRLLLTYTRVGDFAPLVYVLKAAEKQKVRPTAMAVVTDSDDLEATYRQLSKDKTLIPTRIFRNTHLAELWLRHMSPTGLRYGENEP